MLAGALVLMAAACTDSSSSSTAAPVPATAPPTTLPPTTARVTDPVDTTAPVATTGVAGAPTTLPADGVDPAVAAALRAEIDGLVVITEEIRGLPFLEAPDVQVVTTEELAERVRAQLDEEESDLSVEDRLFTLLGLLDPEVDLDELIADLLAEQVLGFYDGETRELVVAGGEAELSAVDKLTVVHELVHALTDQHFKFHERSEALEDQASYDELAALIALAEGDATYFELIYLTERLTFTEQLSIAGELLDFDTAVFDASPQFIQSDLAFPYETGYLFVQRLVSEGGIRAVDDAYLAPPDSTEQVIHPERFFADEPVLAIDLPPTPVPGYEVYEEAGFGEWGLQLFFVDDAAGFAAQVGDGWGGDDYRIMTAGDDVLLVWRYRADREQDAVELAEALIDLASGDMGAGEGVEADGGLLFETDDVYAFVDRTGDTLLFVAASDPVAGAEARRMATGG